MLTWGRAPTELQMPLLVPSGDNQERSGTITQVEAGCLREAGLHLDPELGQGSSWQGLVTPWPQAGRPRLPPGPWIYVYWLPGLHDWFCFQNFYLQAILFQHLGRYLAGVGVGVGRVGRCVGIQPQPDQTSGLPTKLWALQSAKDSMKYKSNIQSAKPRQLGAVCDIWPGFFNK